MNFNKEIHFNWKSKKFKYFAVFLILVGLGAGIYFFFFRNTFSKENIVLQIDTSKEASNGEEITWVVRIRNNSNITIENLKLNFEYPAGTFDEEGSVKKREEEEIDIISPQQEVSKSFSGIIFGKKNEEKESKAYVTYNPKGFSTEFQNESTSSTLITNSFLVFNMKVPKKIDKGEEFEISLSWQSSFSSPLENVQVRLTLPDGFVRTSDVSEKERQETSSGERDSTTQSKIIFDVGTLNEGEGQKVEIKGKLLGEINDEKMFKAEFGKFDEVLYEFIPLSVKESSVKIISSTIEVFRKINGQSEYFPNPGEKLSYIITFKNAGEDIYRDFNLTIELESNVLDFSTLKSQGGEVSNNKIAYSSENIPELLYLGPYDEGNVGFSIDLKSGVLPRNSYIKEKITVGGIKKEYQTKISSQSSFYQYVYYNLPQDLKGKISTSGNYPLEEGKDTYLVIYWRPKNKGNSLQNVKIIGTLGENVSWVDKFYPNNSDFRYDKKTKKVTLNLSNISYNYSKYFAFQVKIRPKDLPENLILDSKLSGKDTWTRQIFENLAQNITTDSVE